MLTLYGGLAPGAGAGAENSRGGGGGGGRGGRGGGVRGGGGGQQLPLKSASEVERERLPLVDNLRVIHPLYLKVLNCFTDGSTSDVWKYIVPPNIA